MHDSSGAETSVKSPVLNRLKFVGAAVRFVNGRLKWKVDSFTLVATAGVAVLSAVLFFTYSPRTVKAPLSLPAESAEALSFPDDERLPEMLLSLSAIWSEATDHGIDEPVPVPTILSTVTWKKYTVVRGDTISGLAAKFGISMSTIIGFNRLENARTLIAGTDLRIPSMDGTSYVVKRGDSLSAIASRFGIRLDDLLDANNMESAVIRPGQELFIPGAAMKPMELKKALGELFSYPVRGRFTSGFGVRRDPFTGVRRFHYGIDLAVPVGTPAKAAMDGKVVMVSTSPTYGNYVILQHADGYQTWYAHLSKARVTSGQRVKEGEVIGNTGNTGYSTGPHLHFAVFRRGKALDPLKYLY